MRRLDVRLVGLKSLWSLIECDLPAADAVKACEEQWLNSTSLFKNEWLDATLMGHVIVV